MRILSSVTILFLLLSSCSSIDKIEFNSIDKKEVYTTIINKEVEINFDENGNFSSAKITVFEVVKIDLPGSKEIASSRALLNAKKILLNFIEESHNASFIEAVSQTLKISTNGSEEKNKAIAQILSKNMKKRKDHIIKSFYIDREIYFRESKTVSIIGKSSSTFAKATKQIKNLFY